jgi:ferredoxin
MSTYRITIDRSLCSGFGSCADLAPNAFAVGADGIATVLVGETDDPAVLQAAESCPMAAIAVEVVEEQEAA